MFAIVEPCPGDTPAHAAILISVSADVPIGLKDPIGYLGNIGAIVIPMILWQTAPFFECLADAKAFPAIARLPFN